ncbi:MAG: rRNA maturation RNase YbeY [Chthonomonadaceae bacterium]|nr:rRNA maturation RNase YbeY [Chthonomonadaceae bacterium]
MDPDPSSRVSVSASRAWRVSTAKLVHAVTSALDAHGRTEGEVAVRLCGDSEIQALNRRYRGLDEPTDVLTFASAGGEGSPLGDVAIAVPFARRQAEARGVALDLEIAYLAMHGALHLLGFDDERETERAEMLSEMNRIARLAGLPEDPEWGSLLHGGAA